MFKLKISSLFYLNMVLGLNLSYATELQKELTYNIKELIYNISEENLIFKIIKNAGGVPNCIAINIDLIDSNKTVSLSYRTKDWQTEKLVGGMSFSCSYKTTDSSTAIRAEEKRLKKQILFGIKENIPEVINAIKNYNNLKSYCNFSTYKINIMDWLQFYKCKKIIDLYNRYRNQYDKINLSELDFKEYGELIDINTLSKFMNYTKEDIIDFAFCGFLDEINPINNIDFSDLL